MALTLKDHQSRGISKERQPVHKKRTESPTFQLETVRNHSLNTQNCLIIHISFFTHVQKRKSKKKLSNKTVSESQTTSQVTNVRINV